MFLFCSKNVLLDWNNTIAGCIVPAHLNELVKIHQIFLFAPTKTHRKQSHTPPPTTSLQLSLDHETSHVIIFLRSSPLAQPQPSCCISPRGGLASRFHRCCGGWMDGWVQIDLRCCTPTRRTRRTADVVRSSCQRCATGWKQTVLGAFNRRTGNQ